LRKCIATNQVVVVWVFLRWRNPESNWPMRFGIAQCPKVPERSVDFSKPFNEEHAEPGSSFPTSIQKCRFYRSTYDSTPIIARKNMARAVMSRLSPAQSYSWLWISQLSNVPSKNFKFITPNRI
jgi:hypothetical protein